MVRPGRERLRGMVEVDESYLGAPDAGKSGRQPGRKTLIVAAVECVGARQLGRIRLRQVRAASAVQLESFIADAVEPGVTVRTDDWSGYRGLAAKGYEHRPTPMRSPSKSTAVVLPRVHRVAARLKRWLLGPHQGVVRPGHLDYYLDEFTFRLNRRTSRSRGKLFYRLLEQAVQMGPTAYKEMIGGKPLEVPNPQHVVGTVVN